MSREINQSDTLNVIPFEDTCCELVRRGVYFKYKPRSKILSITVRYRRLVGSQNFQPHLEARGMVHLPDDEEEETFPFHQDTLVDGCKIDQYNINTRLVRLSDNRHLNAMDVINLILRDML